MRTLLIILLTSLLVTTVSAQRNYKFTYDKNGNLSQKIVKVFPEKRSSVKKDSLLNFKVYPNPSYDYITLEGELPAGCSKADIQIMNIQGMLMRQDWYETGKKSIAVSDLNSGVYILTVKYDSKHQMTYKLIIEH